MTRQDHEKASLFLLYYDDDDDDVEEDKEDPGGHMADRGEAATQQWNHDKEQQSTC